MFWDRLAEKGKRDRSCGEAGAGQGKTFPVYKMGRLECVGEKKHEIRERSGIIRDLGGGYWEGQEVDSLSEDLTGLGLG